MISDGCFALRVDNTVPEHCIIKILYEIWCMFLYTNL